MVEINPPSREEDPRTLNAMEFIRRAAKLPISELASRLGQLSRSLCNNLLTLKWTSCRATAQGKKALFVILTGRMGDLIAAEPVIRHVKTSQDYIVWLCRPRYSNVLQFNPNIDKVMLVSSDMEAVLLKRIFRAERWLQLSVDGDLCNMFGTKIENKNPFGIDSENRFLFGTHTDIFSLLGVGKKIEDRPMLYPDPTFDADNYLVQLFSNSRPILVLHALSDEFSRSWSEQGAVAFAAWVLETTSFNIIETGLAPVLKASERVFLLEGKLPIPCQMAVIAKAAIFIGVDSGFSHIANAASVPSVLLVGRHLGFTDHFPWRLNSMDVVLRGSGQTHEIPVADVVQAVERIVWSLRDHSNDQSSAEEDS